MILKFAFKEQHDYGHLADVVLEEVSEELQAAWKNIPLIEWRPTEKVYPSYPHSQWKGELIRRWNLITVCAIFVTTKDFDPFSDDVLTVKYDTDSYQIRPKQIYQDAKGYFIKPRNSERYRLNEEETEKLNKFILENRNKFPTFGLKYKNK